MPGRDIQSIHMKKLLRARQRENSFTVGFFLLVVIVAMILWGAPLVFEFVTSFKKVI